MATNKTSRLYASVSMCLHTTDVHMLVLLPLNKHIDVQWDCHVRHDSTKWYVRVECLA